MLKKINRNSFLYGQRGKSGCFFSSFAHMHRYSEKSNTSFHFPKQPPEAEKLFFLNAQVTRLNMFVSLYWYTLHNRYHRLNLATPCCTFLALQFCFLHSGPACSPQSGQMGQLSSLNCLLSLICFLPQCLHHCTCPVLTKVEQLPAIYQVFPLHHYKKCPQNTGAKGHSEFNKLLKSLQAIGRQLSQCSNLLSSFIAENKVTSSSSRQNYFYHPPSGLENNLLLFQCIYFFQFGLGGWFLHIFFLYTDRRV